MTNFALVKFFSIFIAVIVLGLSIKPCCSSNSINDLKRTENSSVFCCEDKACSDDNTNNENNKSENKSNGCDFCSPFFTCGSCCGFTFQDNLFQFNSPIFKKLRIYGYYNVQFNSEYIGKMWQPPKLS